MTEKKNLKLRAEDPEDLAVISACLQDAVFAVGEMAYQPAEKRFAAVCVRRRREDYLDDAAMSGALRQSQAAIHFDSVSAVRLSGIDQKKPSHLMRLAGVFSEPGRNALNIRMLFVCGGQVWLEADQLFCYLQDLEQRWESVPIHNGAVS